MEKIRSSLQRLLFEYPEFWSRLNLCTGVVYQKEVRQGIEIFLSLPKRVFEALLLVFLSYLQRPSPKILWLNPVDLEGEEAVKNLEKYIFLEILFEKQVFDKHLSHQQDVTPKLK